VHDKVIGALNKGARLIVIDPRRTDLAGRADLWLQLRPGTDLALAMGLAHVMVEEGLYDRDFTEKWTAGFDRLRVHIQDYTPEKVAGITWLTTDMIREAARLYATSGPACIQWGNPIDQTPNSFQTARAICILRAITGNLGAPGGELEWVVPGNLHRTLTVTPHLAEVMSPEQRKKKLDNDAGFLLQTRGRITPQSLIKAILEDDPYPIRAAYVAGADPITSFANAKETYRALKKLDFLAVAERFMTPTAALADVVLPIGTYLEENGIISPPYSSHLIEIHQRVTRIADCRTDYEIFRDLARRLGHGQHFWEEDAQGADALLGPVGLSFEEFKKVNPIIGSRRYRDYETNGFRTPSGRVELYSSYLEENGLDPLPSYQEPPETPYSDPELAKEYPLIFTNCKEGPFLHSQGRQITSLRGMCPDPLVYMHPETAAGLGIEEGDRVFIETRRGRIQQKARLTTDFDPRVIGVSYGWWFPEDGPSEMYGWSRANINILTDNRGRCGKDMGSAHLRGILCNVYRAE
jgi:anaerobic selenocysteine-containing dehydrogenase